MIHIFTKLISDDMKISLGVTEPGAIALAVSKARSLTSGEVLSVSLEINSGIYKNAFTCGIPNTQETGNLFAAALGLVAGDWRKGLASLEGLTNADVEAARELVDSGKVSVDLHEVSSELYIKAIVKTCSDTAEVTILKTHDNIARIKKNGKIVLEEAHTDQDDSDSRSTDITTYGLEDFWSYAKEIPISEIAFIQKAYDTNLQLMEEGANSIRTDICKLFIAENGEDLCSDDLLKTAQAMTAAAIEARVRGLNRPAMSITGSGNHGIICTMPLYACSQVNGVSQEILLRATALGYLITMYIKEYSGRLSALCGCAVAAGTGASVGLLYMLGGTQKQACYAIENMASSLTGVICTGGNPACVLKAAMAIDIGCKSVNMAMKNIAVDAKHGIIGFTPEQTMRNMGLISSPGMIQTEKTIVDILKEKMSVSVKE